MKVLLIALVGFAVSAHAQTPISASAEAFRCSDGKSYSVVTNQADTQLDIPAGQNHNAGAYSPGLAFCQSSSLNYARAKLPISQINLSRCMDDNAPATLKCFEEFKALGNSIKLADSTLFSVGSIKDAAAAKLGTSSHNEPGIQ